MSNITAAMVKDLRDKTGAGMMDCKAALNENAGDMEAAIDWLRKKGLSKAAKKAGRVAAEGLIGVAVGGDAGALVEVNAETDFVARNEQFKDFVARTAKIALEEAGDLDRLLKKTIEGSRSVSETLTEMVAKIGENMSVRRAVMLGVSEGAVASYVHNAASPELGKIGVLVALKSKADKAKLAALGKQIAMHIAAAAPLALTPEHLPAEVVARERTVQADIARQSGKPESVVEKMMEGRMRKFYQETVLLHQTFVIDGETSIAKVLEKAGKDFGAPVEIEGYVRFQVGEGIEKAESDFADEVNKMAGN
ncbi:MAG: elongation factor Ts [Alphaproteobacteria bacterium]|nr:elongation factor Ts [Alphaproteobacteria bacterium]MBV9692625.1 elongation factor Ts [Alphaproteobacteria bacterium]